MQPKIVFLDRSTLTVPLRPLAFPHEWVDYPLTPAEAVIERLQGATVAVTNKVVIDAQVLAQIPTLKLVAVAATGYNVVDVGACREHGVTVCNVRNYAITGVIEHTLMLMLALRRQLIAYRARIDAGDWQRSASFYLPQPPLHDLAGSTLAIIGSGALGQAMAVTAGALGMRVIVAEHKGATAIRPGRVAFDEALRRADVVSLHCPLTDTTRHLIGAAELGQMKSSAILINTARGSIVDEQALATALADGVIAGAGLDVLSEEPPRRGNPLLEHPVPNLIVTPHIAWASIETMQKLADQLIDNIDAFMRGEPRNVVG